MTGRFRRRRPARSALVQAVLGILFASGPALAAQLDLQWVDTSGGQAAFSIERTIGLTGSYAEIARQPPGVAWYTDVQVEPGTTYCYRVRAVGGAGASDYSNEACGSPAVGFRVTVVKAGTGAGLVVSEPAGIACGGECSWQFWSPAVVTLRATPAPGAVFTGWSGGCTGVEACTIAGNGAVSVRATFAAATLAAAVRQYRLVIRARGRGAVTGMDGDGSRCDGVCTASYASGSVVTLTAVPGPGFRFLRWNDRACGTALTCTVTVTRNRKVEARFGSIR